MIRLAHDARESGPSSPILIAVPHAGRDYPVAMRDLARLDAGQLRVLEDRHADLLPKIAAQHGHEVMIARTARAWIDMNRFAHEMERTAFDVQGPGEALTKDGKCLESAKARGGLGLVPTRIHPHGAIWRAPLSAQDVAERVAQHHAPWHAAIAAGLERRRRHFGHAILVDLHSMPPIRPSRMSGPPPAIVVGDLFGRSAGRGIVERLMSEARTAGFAVARNHPYAGGYTLERHGQPQHHIHAVQIEICRSLYLDAAHDMPSPTLATVQHLVLRLVKAMEDVVSEGLPLAAE